MAAGRDDERVRRLFAEAADLVVGELPRIIREARRLRTLWPEYLMRELGPYPARRSERRAWQQAAVRIEHYRQTFGINDQKCALGTKPRDLGQRAAFREVRREIERSRRQLSRDRERTPEPGRRLR